MPIFMLINDILCVFMILFCHLCFMTTMFMREGDQVKPWSSVQFLIISSLVTFTLFYSQFFNQKSPNTLLLTFVYFGFINLQAVGVWQPPQLVGIAKLFVCCCRLFKERSKGTNLRLPESLIITPSHPCGETVSCYITLRCWIPNAWNFKE
jgi:hypothetical protein